MLWNCDWNIGNWRLKNIPAKTTLKHGMLYTVQYRLTSKLHYFFLPFTSEGMYNNNTIHTFSARNWKKSKVEITIIMRIEKNSWTLVLLKVQVLHEHFTSSAPVTYYVVHVSHFTKNAL